MGFQRARSAEQREERQRTIIATTATMLMEMPVGELSLNALSRRVGLAKSNVLRYYESREAILLELLDDELIEWTKVVSSKTDGIGGQPRRRVEALASEITTSLQERPMLCDLLSAQAGVLERNVSTEVAVEHKLRMLEFAHELGAIVTGVCPELDETDGLEFGAVLILTVSSAWPSCTPSPAVEEAFASEPELEKLHMDFDAIVSRALELCLLGMLAERGVSSR